MPLERDKKSLWAINLGLGINILLSLLKTIFGIIGNSPALLAEGINSTSDVAYYIAASIFMRIARKPADREHPYGHRQMESIASVVIGSFIVTTGVAVFWNSIDRSWDILTGGAKTLGSHPFALWVALGTVAIKLFLAFYIRRLGKETRNPVVEAMAYDHRNDFFSASAASLGIFLGQRGLPWVDPLAGAFVALLILRTGIFVLRESSTELMDVAPSQELCKQIVKTLTTLPNVQLEEMQAHRFGPHIVLNLTIGIDGALRVAEGNAIAIKVETLLRNFIPNVQRVHVHYQPINAQRKNLTIEQILENSHLSTTRYEA